VLEVVLGMESLITKHGSTIQSTIWEKVLKILKRTAEYVSKLYKLKMIHMDKINYIVLFKIELFEL